MRYSVDRMQVQDIPSIVEIERASFSTPWPAGAYVREIEDNALARYVVVREVPEGGQPRAEPRRAFQLPSFLRGGVRDDPAVVAFAGLWLMIDEAHVTSVAVRPSSRGRGLGNLLMWAMFDIGVEMGAQWLTLEVRPSNAVARAMYAGLGFREAGVRPRYYTDNGEDAVIMWSEDLGTPNHADRMRALEASLQSRMTWEKAW